MIIGAIMLAGLGIALAWAVVADRVYRSTAQVIVNVRAPETLGSQSFADQLSPDYLLTQIDIIRSDRIAQMVVARLNMASSPGIAEQLGWRGQGGSLEQFLARRIQASLMLQAGSGKSRVIAIGYSAIDPQFAATMANAFAEAYREASLDLQAQPARDTAQWYERQALDTQRQLAAAQSKLTARQRELGVIADSGQADAEATRLVALSGQLAGVQAQNAMAGARAGSGALPDAMMNPVIQGLQAQIAQLEGQRKLLGTTVGPNHPDLLQLDGQIGELRGQLGQQRRAVQASASAAAAQARSSVSQIVGEVASAKQRVIEGQAKRDEVSVLEQDVKNLQRIYEQMAARRSQLDLLGESGQGNVAILSAAVPAEQPIWPRPKLMAMIGITLGLVLGTALALLLELVDQRMRSGDDFEAWLGIPNLGTLRIGRAQPALMGGSVQRLLPYFGKGRHEHD